LSIELLSLTENVVNYIREKIITGEFKSGLKLNEVVVSSSLNISRPPLREALRILEHEKLVVNISRKGTYVTKITKENLEDVYQTREMIECFAIDLFKAKNIKDFSKIEHAIGHTGEINQKNRIDSLKILNEFHVRLVESAGNIFLKHFYSAIHSNLVRYQFLFFDRIMQFSPEDHKKIYRCLLEGKFEESKDLLRSHIRKFLPLLEIKDDGRITSSEPNDLLASTSSIFDKRLL